MDIAQLTFDEHGGNLELYRQVYLYSASFLNDQEIADLTGQAKSTVSLYRGRLKKTISSAPPSDMTAEALYGYLNMNDMMMQDMMQVYMEMREDREIFRNNQKPADGKRRLPVHAKDLIALMQTLNKTALERAVVLTKFAAVHDKQQNAITNTKNNILPNALMEKNEGDIVDVESVEVRGLG